jgi:hypothetical protein
MKTLKNILLFALLLYGIPLPSLVGAVPKHDEQTKKDIFYYVDSLSSIYQVPSELVVEIGQNESGWRNSDDTNYIRMCGIKGEDSRGDLQVNMKYRKSHGLKSITRLTLLEAGIKHLRKCYDRSGSWRKARFIYGRGHWRPYHRWTRMEKHFMNKINWYKYD